MTTRIEGAALPAARYSPAAPAVEEDALAGVPLAGATRKYVRGSSLLLAGRFISILLNFAAQVLTVRYLAKAEYGAFAYALSVVSLGASTLLLGMGKGVPRFVPIYYERRNYSRALGMIAVAAITIWGLGISLMLLLYGFQGVIAGKVVSDPLALSLLLAMIALSPIEAFGTLLEKVVAIFAKPRAIFFRRHIVAPGCRVLAILLVMSVAGDVYLLAWGYLATASLGVWLYVAILFRAFRGQGLFRRVRQDGLELPARELWGFSIPIFSTEISVMLRTSVVVILLEFFHSTIAVAEFKAVLPVAGLNMLVFEAFSFLFVPLASRMFARAEHESIGDLYWQTALWISVLTFPVFALTCALAQPLTVLLFGERYASAGFLLALLSAGHYFNASLGFNAATLRVYGRVRFIVVSELLAAALAVVIAFVLIRSHGALGAAIGTTASLVLRTTFNQFGLRTCGAGIRPLEWKFLRVYAAVLLLSMTLLGAQRLAAVPPAASLAFAGIGFLVLVRLTRRVLQPETAFPELMRIPLVRTLLS
ncbi:MAG TPA: hypothetical protein VNK41_10965 [Vicinamibacterales bacterium]|nr:hypothetical protein [Vicinamibacterales bacterium]